MKTRNLSTRKSLTTQSGANLNVAVRGSLYDAESQIRRGTQVVGYRGNKRPGGLKENDVTVRPYESGVAVAISDAKGNTQEVIMSPDFNDYVEYHEGTGAPTLANFPENADWGMYFDTAATALYLIRNREGTLLKPHFLSLTGSLQTGQHGDRSAEVATMHAFTQISGAITAAQHGNQTSGALHAVATGATAGFLSAADKTKLDDATSSATASTLVLRGGGGGASFGGTVVAAAITASGTITGATVNTTGRFQVAGTNVIGPRDTGFTAFTGATNKGTAYDTATITHPQLAERVAALQAAMFTHGLIG